MDMAEDLILKKRLFLNTYIVKGTLAMRKRCLFPKPLLLLLQEKGFLEPKFVASELLCNSHLTRVARLWIDTIIVQGLVSQNENGEMFITEEGERYLQNGLAFVAEEGEWIITFCESDSRVDNRIIDVRKIDTSKMSAKQRKDFDAKINRKLQGIRDPDICFMLEPNQILNTIDDKEFRVVDLNPMQCFGLKNESSLYICWNVSKGFVSEKYQGKEYLRTSLPEWASESEDEIIARAVTETMRWMNVDVCYDENGKLCVPFISYLSDETKRTLVIDCPIEKTKAGLWDRLNIPVTLTPLSDKDALEWLVWLFIDGIDKYITDGYFNSLLKDITQKLNWRIDGDGLCKIDFLQEILKNYQIAGNKRMFIQATLDWNL